LTEARVSFSFFGLQVAFKRDSRDPLPGQLHHLLARDAGARQSITDKQRFWRNVTSLLAPASSAFEFGDWDLVRGFGAAGDYDEWVADIEEGLAPDPHGDRNDLVADGGVDASPSYVLATMMVLVDGGSNADETLGIGCDIPESDWLTRATFAQLLAILPRLNFANVQSDAIYLVPGRGRQGPSAADLVSHDYRLRPLT
jgi:hypothetical protein